MFPALLCLIRRSPTAAGRYELPLRGTWREILLNKPKPTEWSFFCQSKQWLSSLMSDTRTTCWSDKGANTGQSLTCVFSLCVTRNQLASSCFVFHEIRNSSCSYLYVSISISLLYFEISGFDTKLFSFIGEIELSEFFIATYNCPPFHHILSRLCLLWNILIHDVKLLLKSCWCILESNVLTNLCQVSQLRRRRKTINSH